MVVKGNHIIFVFFIFAILAATSLFSSVTNGKENLPLNKKGEVQGRASFLARNEALVANFTEEMRARSEGDRALFPFVQSLNNISLTITPEKNTALSGQEERATKWLNQALTSLDNRSELNAATLRAAPSFAFSPTFVNSEIDQTLVENLLSLELAAWYAPAGDKAIWVGAFLIAPNTEYLLHTHDAHEIYFVLSGYLDLQYGVEGDYFMVGPDQYSITPSHCPHALRTGDAPVLMLYVWDGMPDPESWWWERQEVGSWWRTPWMWQNDGAWQKVAPTEKVTEQIIKASHSYPRCPPPK